MSLVQFSDTCFSTHNEDILNANICTPWLRQCIFCYAILIQQSRLASLQRLAQYTATTAAAALLQSHLPELNLDVISGSSCASCLCNHHSITALCQSGAVVVKPAGAALVNAHGKSQFQPMLQLFEGYLDKKDVGDEARYDKVREGAIVFLGTLARHLDPSDAKVIFVQH